MLSDIAAKKAKPQEKPYKLSDGKGLYLLVNPNGGKLWRMSYRHGGKQKTLALGVYPEVALAKARERVEEARRMLADGIDPMADRKATKEGNAERAKNSFEAVAREWLALNVGKWAETTHRHIKERLENNLFPWIGARPAAEVTARELLAALNKTVERGRIDTATRVRSDAGRVFCYAVATGRAERNPTADLAGALPSAKTRHRATLVEPKAVGELLRAIGAYSGLSLSGPRSSWPPGLSQAGRTGASGVGGIRPGRRGVAHPRRTHEDEGAAHRPAVAASGVILLP